MANCGIRAFVAVCLLTAATCFAQICQNANLPCEFPLLAASTTSALSTLADSPAYTFRSRVDEVSLTFSITDQRGEPVSALQPDELTVLDSRQQVTNLKLVSYDHLRMRIGMLVDWSESLKDRRTFEQEAATDFLRRVMRPDYDDGFVMGIGTKWRITQPLTRDPESMVKNLTAADDGYLTSLYDALIAACNGEIHKPTADVTTRRTIILLSDGQDNDSIHGLDDAIQAAQHGDVAIFAIARRGKRWSWRGEKVLTQLTESTGGHVYIVKSPAEYSAAFQAIERQLRAGYTVSYKPLNLKRDGRFRPVEIRPRDPGLTVHARSGYYAPLE